MTYFSYCKAQYSDYEAPPVAPPKPFESRETRPVKLYDQPPKRIPMALPKPTFMPSRLVRIADMNVVRGSEVNEGYCTLSYSWNQSGELVKNETTGEIDRVDQGKHQIVFTDKECIVRNILHVKFEGLIQEICKDFNVKYIWYDQMCINQSDKEEKHREIRQMHKIYQNAYCAIVLVPELRTCETTSYPMRGGYTAHTYDDSLLWSQWMKRAWTLEEALMSSKMLFIGKRVHSWWYRISSELFPIFKKDINYNIATILHYAHARISTKEHDRMFALANIIPDVMANITIDYDQDIQELMIRFYGILAERDIGILCFEPHRHYKAMCSTASYITITPEYSVPIKKFDLPSWTGVDGEHLCGHSFTTSFRNYTVIGRTMEITCTGITNDQRSTTISALDLITPRDLPPCPRRREGCNWMLVVPVQLPRCSCDKLICFYCEITFTFSDSIVIQLLAHFLPIKKENLQWIPVGMVPTIQFNLSFLTEALDDYSHCTLLTGVQFKRHEDIGGNMSCPVVKKYGNYYKAIGLCHIKDHDGQLLQHGTFKEQTYKIQ